MRAQYLSAFTSSDIPDWQLALPLILLIVTSQLVRSLGVSRETSNDAQNATGPDRGLRCHQLGAEPSRRPRRTDGPWHDTNYGRGRLASEATGHCLPALLVAAGPAPLPLV